MDNFSLQYPVWFIFFCVLAGLVYAGFLYYRDARFKDHSYWKLWLLAVLRFLSVFGISFMLLGPLLKLNNEEIKNPTVVIFQDGSSSVASDTEVISKLQDINEELGKEFQVETYHYDNSIHEGFTDSLDGGASNLSQVFEFVDETYTNQNLGAIIVSSDGIYNEGQNPIYQRTNITSPVYFLAQGDTTQKKDISIKQVYHNKIAYLGDKFVVQADVQAYNFNASNTSINLYRDQGGQRVLVDKQAFSIKGERFFTTLSFEVPADQVGIVKYILSVDQRSGAFSTKNNTTSFIVDILDARQKILLLGNSPHPDIAAIKKMIESNKNYEVEVAFAKDTPANLTSFDLVMFHNLPSRRYNVSSVLSSLNRLNKPRMFIAGTQIDIPAFNRAQKAMSIRANTQSTNDVQAKLAEGFNVFEIDEGIQNIVEDYPPLKAKFGSFKVNPNTRVLMNQKIGEVETEYPLWVLRNQSDLREAVIVGEGIWQWRLYNYLQKNRFDEINELFSKTIQFVTIKEDKRKFRVSSTNNVYKTYDKVGFDAELYNDTYEKVNEADAFLKVKDQDGKEYEYTFSKVSDFYQLDAGSLPAGNYTFTGTTNYNGQPLTSSGRFSIEDVQLEFANTTANHSLLRNINTKYGGQVFYEESTDEIVGALKEQSTLKPIIYSTMKTESALNLKWILFVLVGFLFIEWFVRRLLGTY